MRTTFIIILVASLSALTAWKMKPEMEQAPTPHPLVSVQEMGTLVSLKVNYANVIEFTESVTQGIPWTQWELTLGGTRVLLVARGECLIGTDLTQAQYEQSTAATKTATLVAPNPKVISARLNHDRKTGGSYFYAVSRSGIDALVPSTKNQVKATNGALQKAQSEMEASCAKPELLESARKSAEAVLVPALSATGWKIAVVWR